MTPASSDPDRAREMYEFDEPVLGPITDNRIHTYHDYMEALDHIKLPVNFASMIGTGAVKITVKGFADGGGQGIGGGRHERGGGRCIRGYYVPA